MKRFDAVFFGIAVSLKREMEAMSLRELGEQLGVSASTLSRIENGDKPDIDTFVNLLDWLKLSPERFIKDVTP